MSFAVGETYLPFPDFSSNILCISARADLPPVRAVKASKRGVPSSGKIPILLRSFSENMLTKKF